MSKVIVRIRGGLGNQLFCYAAGRRLALANDAELVLDTVTGFVRDRQYQRRYMLDAFRISARKTSRWERMQPLERYRRALAKMISGVRPFGKRSYIVQEGLDFDPRLLDLRIKGSVYLDGLWQSEDYFKDVEHIIRQDLRIEPPQDEMNRLAAGAIENCRAVCIHVRWFEPPNRVGDLGQYNVGKEYYDRAVAEIEAAVPGAHYFVFSDFPVEAARMLHMPEGRHTCVHHNTSPGTEYVDLWLMTHCRHFVIGNSTFGWWAAWLSKAQEKTVIAPAVKIAGTAAWGFKGLIPHGWLQL